MIMSWSPAVFGLVFLTFNSMSAVYKSRGEPWSVVFVVSAYAALLLLFWCLRELEGLSVADPGAPKKKGRLKVGIWSLSTTVTAMFSYRVAAIMPPLLAVIVWGLAGSTTVAGFCAFFLHRF